MKWNLAQLEKEKLPIDIKKSVDYKKEVLSNSEVLADFVLNIDLILSKISNTAYLFSGSISTNLLLEDCITLEKVNYFLEEDINEIFDVDHTLFEDSNIIEKDFINIEEVLLEIVKLNIPISVIKDKNKKFEDFKLGNEDINLVFESLKDFLKK